MLREVLSFEWGRCKKRAVTDRATSADLEPLILSKTPGHEAGVFLSC